MAVPSRVSILVLILLVLLASLYRSSQGVSGDDRAVFAAGSTRSLLAIQRNNQLSSCSEMVSRSQCSRNSKCRWCRSEALDDMCFSKSAAWRLPEQVFSCD